MKRFEGIFTVMLTTYDDYGNVDREAMREITDYLVESGVHGLVVLGSNGENPYLTHHHQKDVIDTVIDACAQRIPVIVGVNKRGTEPAVDMSRYAEEAGADGLLIALHRFYNLDEDAVYAFYEDVCGSVSLPVLFYNFPSNTGLALAPGSIARIAVIDNMVGAKETIFEVEEVRALVEATDEDFCVFTGMTFNLVETMAVGACGAICPVPNFIPEKTVELYEACRNGDAERAQELQKDVFSLAPLLASTPTPHAMQKEALRLLGHPVMTHVKGPLPRLTSEQAKLVRETLENAGLI
ncbi:MAG: dihydrodipicolinate synthase family protein [Actinomycetota bacterium]|nr:dihydrodipicolinate synthase family protein [Actinomycetota bacterium]MDD5667961.1 dihydrodipicolinate synthase family protein [Actinomycetota bacterium]